MDCLRIEQLSLEKEMGFGCKILYGNFYRV